MPYSLPFGAISANVVALDEVLGAYETRFQGAVHRALLQEGFEVESGLPNLQRALEIRDAIGWFLKNQGYEAAWESLQMFLEWADRQGVLVDLSLDPDHWPATA
jgi:hypothetical protein